MTDDQFEKLAQLIKSAHDDLSDTIAEVRAELKADITEIHTELKADIAGMRVKVDGIQNTLDNESIVRQDQKLPQRLDLIEGYLDSQSTGWKGRGAHAA